MQIPVIYLLDLRYVARLLDSTTVELESQLGGCPANLAAAVTVLRRITDGYSDTFAFLDARQTQGGMG